MARCAIPVIIVDMKKTIIWDYNGTIIDDLSLCLSVENKMLSDRNMKSGYTREEYLDMFCFPVIDYYRKLGYTFEDETYDELSVIFNDLYDEGFGSVTLCEGFEELIGESIKKGYRNVILSAAKHDKLVRQCRDLGIDGYFDEILGIDNLLAGSKIEMARKWMDDSGTLPDDCMFIGDSLHDLDTAKALGVDDVILVASGHQSGGVLKKSWDNVVSSLKEITL